MAEYRLSYTGEQVDALLGQINSAIPITYSQLKNLRDGSKLAPGKFYRITDYVTTTTDPESRSVGHQFDIIVLALDESHLSEESYAAHHTGDSYFANSNLDAWRLMYCLDNDLIRFTWADTTNGRGVIYRMIDEFNNDVPYDFKNIQFKRYAITADSKYSASLGQLNGLRIGHPGVFGCTINSSNYYWYYTFSSLGNSWDSCTDASLDGSQTFNNSFVTYAVSGMFLYNLVFANGPIVATTIESLGLTLSGYHDNERCHQTYSKETNKVTCFGNWNSNEIAGNCANHLFFGSVRHNLIDNDWKDNTIVGDYVFNKIHLTQNVIFASSGTSHNGPFWLRDCYIYCQLFGYNRGFWIHDCDFICPNENVYYNELSYMHDNTFYGRVRYTHFLFNATNNVFAYSIDGCTFGAQCRYLNVQTPMTFIDFDAVVEYVDIPAVSGKTFSNNHISNLRGSSTSRIKLGNTNFYLDAITGIKRRVNIEGNNDGEIVATWKGTHGVVQGVYATPAESQAGTWHTI